jgi:RNA polymerase sigma-70 factor (ECF subfamily)
MDEDILRACRQGNPQAIESLVREHQGAVYRVCISILDDPSDAEDAAQETFIAAVRGLAGFRGGSTFRTWLFTIAVNVCRRQLRRRKRGLALHSSLRQTQPALAEASPDPEQTIIRAEVTDALRQAIAGLDEKHRLPVILRYFHELPVSEIARILGVNEGTLHSRLFNARERLRSHMHVRQTLYKDQKGARR